MSSPSTSSFSSPSFTPSGSPPTPPGNPTQSSSGNNSNESSGLASASLYLYTFLATLVLLLVVSAAIVVRSFILRRRHRRMLEALGTNLTGPFPSPYQRPRVDLSKKPKMWDAWIEAPEEPTGGRSREQEWYWDMMKPFSATHAAPPGGAGSRSNEDPSYRSGNYTYPRPTFRDRVGSAARHLVYYVGTRPSSLSGSASPSTTQLASPTALPNLDSGNTIMKVAVLIAMPSQKSSPSSISASSRSPLSSSSSSAPPQHPAVSSITPHPSSSSSDEEPLPHLEIGVTEVRVVPNHDEPDLESPPKRSTASE